MAIRASPTPMGSPSSDMETSELLLEAGDRLSRAEFERSHAQPDSSVGTWLGIYAAETHGVELLHNRSVRLYLDNEPHLSSF